MTCVELLGAGAWVWISLLSLASNSRTHVSHAFLKCMFPRMAMYFTAQKLTLTPRERNFQSVNAWGLGDFGSWLQWGFRVSFWAVSAR